MPGPAGPAWPLSCAPRAAVAQLARASACHAEGRGFESHQPLRSLWLGTATGRVSGPSTTPRREGLGLREPLFKAGAGELRARVGQRGALRIGRGVRVAGLRQRTATGLADLERVTRLAKSAAATSARRRLVRRRIRAVLPIPGSPRTTSDPLSPPAHRRATRRSWRTRGRARRAQKKRPLLDGADWSP